MAREDERRRRITRDLREWPRATDRDRPEILETVRRELVPYLYVITGSVCRSVSPGKQIK